jgi:hypothetical protein
LDGQKANALAPAPRDATGIGLRGNNNQYSPLTTSPHTFADEDGCFRQIILRHCIKNKSFFMFFIVINRNTMSSKTRTQLPESLRLAGLRELIGLLGLSR